MLFFAGLFLGLCVGMVVGPFALWAVFTRLGWQHR